jgi:hypothetical protein
MRPRFSEGSFLNHIQVFLRHGLGCTLALTASLTALAQAAPGDDAITPGTTQSTPASSRASEATLQLPDAPGYSSSSPQTAAAGQQYVHIAPPTTAAPERTQLARRYDQYIDVTEIPQHLSARDKVILGLRAPATPWTLISITAAAGEEHLLNSSPNYGTNSEAFAQRVGAAAARRASYSIFSASIFAPLFHEDPRYYQLGPQHSVLARTTYAITRVFVTRNDDGSPTPNLALFAGYAGTVALNTTYYPADNQGFSEGAKGFAGSLGGAAFGFVVREFLDEALQDAHMRKKD